MYLTGVFFQIAARGIELEIAGSDFAFSMPHCQLKAAYGPCGLAIDFAAGIIVFSKEISFQAVRVMIELPTGHGSFYFARSASNSPSVFMMSCFRYLS